MAQLTLFPLQYQRQDATPIDIDMVFATTTLRNQYLSSPRRYPGQIVADLELQKCFVLNTAGDAWLPIGPDVVTSVTNGSAAVPTGDAVYDFVKSEISALVDSAPGLLDTLNELAAALNDDPDFYNTITNMIALKADKTDIGNLVDLDTTDKSSIVAAINELYNNDATYVPNLAANLTVQLGSGVQLGGTQTGQTFNAGTSLEDVLRTILIKTIPPTYVSPSAALSSSVSTAGIEVGTNITPQFNISFSQNDGGAETAREIRLNGVVLSGSTSTPFTAPQLQVTDSNNTYQGFVSYSQGACKNNNLGAQDCNGRINAGTANSNGITYVGYRNAFWGFTGTTPATSAAVRSLGNATLNPQNGTTFTINIPIGATRVTFAYPATLRAVSTVKYVELSNSEVKGNFSETTVAVEGANGYAAVNYRVYTYAPVEPFSQAVTYNVTI